MVKAKDDGPTPPKRPLSAFFLFKNDVFQQTKEEHPESKVTELTKIISEKWKECDSKTKEKYEQKQAEAKEKYQENIKNFEAEHGPIEKKKRKGKGKGKKGGDSDDEDDDEDDSDDDKKKKKSKGKKK